MTIDIVDLTTNNTIRTHFRRRGPRHVTEMPKKFGMLAGGRNPGALETLVAVEVDEEM